MRWDTSAIPVDATITGASLTVHVTNRSATNGGMFRGDWYQWDGVSATDHVIEVGNNAIADMAMLPTGAGQVITLQNASANVSKTGFTYVRTGMSGTATPTGADECAFASANNISSFALPTLTVDYTLDTGPPAAPTGLTATVIEA